MSDLGYAALFTGSEFKTARRQNKKSISICAKGYGEKKVIKSTQGMPWLSEAMKDVISCDKPRGLANMN